MLEDIFGERHWSRASLEEDVARGLSLEEDNGDVFTWLTCTNAGAGDVCRAALRVEGIAEEDLATVYLCDPASKSTLRVLARPGIKVRPSAT